MQQDLLTYVIPTHNRPHFLRRLLAFQAECAPACRMLIADSSRPELALENQAVLRAAGLTGPVQYRHFGGSVVDKCAEAMTLVETPYTVFCADDDFLIPSAVGQCVEFLETAPDYASAMGRMAKFRVRGDRFHCHVRRGYSVEHSRPFDRCQAYADHWFTNFYAVYRTPAIRKNMRITADYTDSRFTYALPETLLAQLSVVRGRCKVFPFLYSIMELHSQNAGAESKSGVRVDAEMHYQRFKSGLGKELAETGVSEDDASRFIDQWFGYLRSPDLRVRIRPMSLTETAARGAKGLGYRLLNVAGIDLGRHRRFLRKADTREAGAAWSCAVRLFLEAPQGVWRTVAKAS